MPDYQVKIVDAFTTKRYAGNACGVVTQAEGLTDEQMQSIGRGTSRPARASRKIP